MTVKQLLDELNKIDNKESKIIIDMLDREYSCFEFFVDSKNDGYVYLVNDK